MDATPFLNNLGFIEKLRIKKSKRGITTKPEDEEKMLTVLGYAD
jgi:hypothetical protein